MLTICDLHHQKRHAEALARVEKSNLDRIERVEAEARAAAEREAARVKRKAEEAERREVERLQRREAKQAAAARKQAAAEARIRAAAEAARNPPPPPSLQQPLHAGGSSQYMSSLEASAAGAGAGAGGSSASMRIKLNVAHPSSSSNFPDPLDELEALVDEMPSSSRSKPRPSTISSLEQLPFTGGGGDEGDSRESSPFSDFESLGQPGAAKRRRLNDDDGQSETGTDGGLNGESGLTEMDERELRAKSKGGRVKQPGVGKVRLERSPRGILRA